MTLQGIFRLKPSYRFSAAAILLVSSLCVARTASAQQVITIGKIGGFSLPTAVSLDAEGNLFVADTFNSEIDEIPAANGYGSAIVKVYGPLEPTTVAVDTGDNIFLTDRTNNTVHEFTAADHYFSDHILAATDGNFSRPGGVALDANGNLFVADFGNAVIKELLAPDYTTVRIIGGGNTGLLAPGAIAIDAVGNLFVTTANNAIQEVSAADGYTTVVTLAVANGNFNFPNGIAVDDGGNLFVADWGNNLVKEILAAGGYVTVNTLNAGDLDGPSGVAVGRNGNVFVSDTYHDAVKEILLSPSPLAASILPGSRSVQADAPATVFATIVNGSDSDLAPCGVALISPPPPNASLVMSYQTTDPATNALTGTANQTVSIAAHTSQSFALSFQAGPGQSWTALAPEFFCEGVSPAPILTGVDTIDLTFAAGPVADIIALSATATGDGTLHMSSGTGAFAIAAVDAGAPANLTVSADSGTATLPLALTLCQTMPSGQCLAPPAGTVQASFAAGGTATFSVFASSSGAIPFAPGASRIFVRFLDSSDALHGTTSVAVTTN